jgi:hypothetical protein
VSYISASLVDGIFFLYFSDYSSAHRSELISTFQVDFVSVGSR